MDGAKVGAAAGGEGVLANFFNSLLHKKTGTPSPGKGQGRARMEIPLYAWCGHNWCLI